MLSLNYRYIAALAGGGLLLFVGGCGPGGDDSAAGSATIGDATSDATTGTDQGGEEATWIGSGTGTDTDANKDTNTDTGTEPVSTGPTGESTGEAGPDACFDVLGGGGECCSANTAWPFMLRAHDVTLDLLVNGEIYEGSVYDDADIYLVNTESGDRAHFGRLSQGTLSGTVLEGIYQVSYEARDTAYSIPHNSRTVVLDGLTVDGTTTETIDIVSLEVDLGLTFNGMAPGKSPYDDGVLSVQRAGDVGRTVIGKTSTAWNGLTVKLIDGAYDFFYESEDRGTTMPHNTLAWLDATTLNRGMVGAEDEFNTAHAIDVSVVTVAGPIDFDGIEPPQSAFDYGHIYLRDRQNGSVTRIADTREGQIKPVPVIANPEYDLFYGAEMVGPGAPANRWGRLNSALILGDDAPLTGADLADLAKLSLPTMTVEGTITVDGESKPADPDNRGELLVGDLEGDRGELGDIAVGIQSKLLRGDYEIFFRHDVSDGGLPANTFGRVGAESVLSDDEEPLAVNVKTTALGGQITIGGKTPPLSVYDDGEIYLRNSAGDRVFLSRTRSGLYSRRIVEGTYDVYYAVVNSQGGVPANGETLLLADVKIEGETQTIDIDVPIVDFGGWNLPFLPGGSGKARYFLRKVATDDEIFLGKAEEYASVRVVPGEYELVYRLETLGVGTPRNDGAVLACYSIAE